MELVPVMSASREQLQRPRLRLPMVHVVEVRDVPCLEVAASQLQAKPYPEPPLMWELMAFLVYHMIAPDHMTSDLVLAAVLEHLVRCSDLMRVVIELRAEAFLLVMLRGCGSRLEVASWGYRESAIGSHWL